MYVHDIDSHLVQNERTAENAYFIDPSSLVDKLANFIALQCCFQTDMFCKILEEEEEICLSSWLDWILV